MSGAVFQFRAPDPTGQAADNTRNIQRGEGYREGKGLVREHKEGEDTDARGR